MYGIILKWLSYSAVFMLGYFTFALLSMNKKSKTARETLLGFKIDLKEEKIEALEQKNVWAYEEIADLKQSLRGD